MQKSIPQLAEALRSSLGPAGQEDTGFVKRDTESPYSPVDVDELETVLKEAVKEGVSEALEEYDEMASKRAREASEKSSGRTWTKLLPGALTLGSLAYLARRRQRQQSGSEGGYSTSTETESVETSSRT